MESSRTRNVWGNFLSLLGIVLAIWLFSQILHLNWSNMAATISRSIPAQAQTTASDCRQMAYEAASAAGIPPDLFYKQIYEESGCRNVTSPAGAVGVCQFLPETAAGLGVDPYDPASCLKGAAQMMARYVQEFGSYDKALAAYNCGGSCTRAALAYGADWGCHIPAETRVYIWTIMGEQVCP
jgi:soluble lytic murein transglycosylase-like protein